MKRPFVAMWGWPILMGVLTVVGLISALLGDGIWDYLSALTLGIPVLACGWYSLVRGKNGKQ